jgi:hypothetical protein
LNMSYHDESSLEIRYELASRRAEDRAEQRAESLRAMQQDEDDQEEQEPVGELPSIFDHEQKPLPLPGAE